MLKRFERKNIFLCHYMPLALQQFKPYNKLVINSGLFAVIVLLTISVPFAYVSMEYCFNGGDINDEFQIYANQVALAFRESPFKAIQLIRESLAWEYNRIFALPLIPFILIFGDSRLTFVISLALVYLLPFSLTLGVIATKVVPVHPRTVYWSTALLTLLIPTNWIPTLYSYHDTDGALLVALATLVYLQDVNLKHRWQVPLIGFLLGAAILLRRHFVYGGLALLLAIISYGLIVFFAQLRQKLQLRRSWQNLLDYSLRVGVIVVTILITLFTIAPTWTYRALTEDKITLYASWSKPFSEVFQLYTSLYGWTIWMLVVLGLFLGILTRTLDPITTIFISLFGGFALILWLGKLRYYDTFYALHFSPLVTLGLVAFFWTIWIRLRGKLRIMLLGTFSLYLICNMVIGLTYIGQFNNPLRPLFAANFPLILHLKTTSLTSLLLGRS